MKAGFKLDALVAEKVLGLGVDWRCCEDGHWTTLPPAYSTDIVAAWPIAEKLGIALIPLHKGPTVADGVCWEAVGRCTIGHYYAGDGCCVSEVSLSPKNDVIATAETAPLAICLAALKTVGVNIDNEEA